MFRKPHLILGRDLDEQLAKTLKVCGSLALSRFVNKEKIKLTPKTQLLLDYNISTTFVWEGLLDDTNLQLFDLEGVDLLKLMLNPNPEERITIEAALSHPFLNKS